MTTRASDIQNNEMQNNNNSTETTPSPKRPLRIVAKKIRDVSTQNSPNKDFVTTKKNGNGVVKSKGRPRKLLLPKFGKSEAIADTSSPLVAHRRRSDVAAVHSFPFSGTPLRSDRAVSAPVPGLVGHEEVEHTARAYNAGVQQFDVAQSMERQGTPSNEADIPIPTTESEAPTNHGDDIQEGHALRESSKCNTLLLALMSSKQRKNPRDRDAEGSVYVFQDPSHSICKVGISANSWNRIKQLTKDCRAKKTTWTPYGPEVAILPAPLHRRAEKVAQKALALKQHSGICGCGDKHNGHTELFSIDPDTAQKAVEWAAKFASQAYCTTTSSSEYLLKSHWKCAINKLGRQSINHHDMAAVNHFFSNWVDETAGAESFWHESVQKIESWAYLKWKGTKQHAWDHLHIYLPFILALGLRQYAVLSHLLLGFLIKLLVNVVSPERSYDIADIWTKNKARVKQKEQIPPNPGPESVDESTDEESSDGSS